MLIANVFKDAVACPRFPCVVLTRFVVYILCDIGQCAHAGQPLERGNVMVRQVE